MTALRNAFVGPWRAVSVLGVTQILAWGSIFYSPVLTVPLIAAERGWSLSFSMSGFSLALLVAGLAAPHVGGTIDRYGGHFTMCAGSLVGAVGLLALAFADSAPAYLAVWMLLGLGLSASLYDAAFATLGRIFGPAARGPITVLTLAGGFASTVGWPATQFLIATVGWRGAYLTYAALLALICAPLHALALPRSRAPIAVPATDANAASVATPVHVSPHGMVFILVAAAFASHAFVPSALSAHLLAIFGRAGMDAATVVLIGALFGPAQVAARLTEFLFARNLHPLTLAKFSVALLLAAFVMLALFGISVPSAAAFSVMFGAANGLITIARGAVPLALFGAAGYGRLIGRIAAPFQIMQAAAPLVMALVAERLSDPAALALAALFTAVALACFAVIRRPGTASRSD